MQPFGGAAQLQFRVLHSLELRVDQYAPAQPVPVQVCANLVSIAAQIAFAGVQLPVFGVEHQRRLGFLCPVH